MPKFIDTHIHLQDFNRDFALNVLKDKSVKRLVLVSVNKDDFDKVAVLARRYPEKVVPAFGVHPWYADNSFSIEVLREKLKEFPKALVGEIGLDALKKPVDEAQQELFSVQLKLAEELNRPVIVHAARAFEALKDFKYVLSRIRYVHHGFVKNRELLRFIDETGGYFGLGDLFLKQEKAREMWQIMPGERVLFETDAPYRIKEENYPAEVRENLIKLAAIADENIENTAERMVCNANRFLEF